MNRSILGAILGGIAGIAINVSDKRKREAAGATPTSNAEKVGTVLAFASAGLLLGRYLDPTEEGEV